jgi:hypothetical protein
MSQNFLVSESAVLGIARAVLDLEDQLTQPGGGVSHAAVLQLDPAGEPGGAGANRDHVICISHFDSLR